jgi:Protein of unknown function (DUF3102)
MADRTITRRLPHAEQWANRICTQLGKSVEAILEVGRLLIAAKADLAHGEWGQLFDNKLIPFSLDTAQRLMTIAQHPVLSNTANSRYLPSTWYTLYELTKVDRATLRQALKTGVITPDMPARAVKALLPATAAAAPKPRQPQWKAEAYRSPGSGLYFRVVHLLSDEFDRLSTEEQDLFLDLIDQHLTKRRANRTLGASL